MAISSTTFTDIGGAVQDIFGGESNAKALMSTAQGAGLEAQNYGMAADLALKNRQYTEESTAIQVLQQQRTNLQAYGATTAGQSGAGFRNSGSGLDILRDNMQQGTIAVKTLQKQGLITEEGYDEQAKAYKNLQEAAQFQQQADEQAARDSEDNGLFGGILKGVAAVASLF